MWKFKNKPIKRPAAQRGDALASHIANAIIRRQRQAAAYLERKTQYWNKTSKLVALLIFCLVFGGCSLWLLIKSIF
ncbi:MAG TPA: hypothetical protein VFE53_04905 [Mucilaginibacter sp.]|jgi:hypothetical protein|nr:hypothetical protein [Mucilaginibacter sp.]